MILESQFKHFLGYSLVLVVAIVALLLSPSSLYAQKKVESEEFIIRYSLKSTEVEEDILDNKANLAKINDYLLRSPRIDSITIGRGNPEWGAPADRDVFIIKHHREPSPFVVGKDFKQ